MEKLAHFNDGITEGILLYNPLAMRFKIIIYINKVLIESSYINYTNQIDKSFAWQLLDFKFLAWSNFALTNTYGFYGERTIESTEVNK